MHLRESEDEQAVHELFTSFFANESSIEVVRSCEDLGFEPALWSKLCATGAPGMAVPEAHGGAGATLTDLSLLATEAGRRLAPVPIIEHAVTARLMASATNLPAAVATGDHLATLALRPANDGLCDLVPGGAVAHTVVGLDDGDLVAATNAPPGEAPANTAAAPLANRTLRDGDRTVLASGPEAVELWTGALLEWQALMASALTGLGFEALHLGVEYVKERHQFGVPVGSFQAVQHGLADASVRLEGSNFLSNKAIWALQSGQPDAERLARMAFLFATETAQRSAASSLQYHGGYGFAEEYDIQLYYRRARGWPLALGSTAAQYQHLADVTVGAVN